MKLLRDTLDLLIKRFFKPCEDFGIWFNLSTIT